MNLPNTLLLTYQAEYETTDIDINSLCEKYDVTPNQLKGRDTWTKRLPEPTETTIANDIIAIPDTNEAMVAKNTEGILKDIDSFKHSAVAHAIKFMADDAQFAEVKEFKDMVAIVDSIEKSYKDTNDNKGTTINMVVQNMMTKFQDDC